MVYNNSLYTEKDVKKFKQLQLKTLNNYVVKMHICDRPSDGWIRSIRKSLGMNIRQLAERVNIAPQTASQFEMNELNDSITLKTLRRVAEAMECRLVYAIVPNNGDLEDIVKKQAHKKAKEIVESVNHTMVLEDQEVGNIKEKIDHIEGELINSMNSKLWNK